jgi:hypothetical protein
VDPAEVVAPRAKRLIRADVQAAERLGDASGREAGSERMRPRAGLWGLLPGPFAMKSTSDTYRSDTRLEHDLSAMYVVPFDAHRSIFLYLI